MPHVQVNGVRDVLDHDQEVGGGQPSEDGVGRGDHGAACEDGHVDDIGDGAEDAHHEGQPPVHPLVALPHLRPLVAAAVLLKENGKRAL